jgi:hypothetical protein
VAIDPEINCIAKNLVDDLGNKAGNGVANRPVNELGKNNSAAKCSKKNKK